jgi:2-iminobutanoate/2-iminopropanoate deaminase
MRQQSIDIEALSHNAPIPLACRVGSFLVTSAIGGKNVANGKLPAEPGEEAFHCFENLKIVLDKAGMDLGDVVKIDVLVTDEKFREVINKVWIDCYPNRQNRPARHTHTGPLRGGQLMQIIAMAIAK